MKRNEKKSGENVIREPAVAYVKRTAVPARVLPMNNSKQNAPGYWLGNIKSLSNPSLSEFDLLKTSETGIPKSSIDALAVHLNISRKSIAEDVFDVSVKTMERKLPSEKLDKKISSHAIEIARLMVRLWLVLEDEQKIKRWLHHENRALSGAAPISLLDTMTGLSLVNDIVTRIEEGVYS